MMGNLPIKNMRRSISKITTDNVTTHESIKPPRQESYTAKKIFDFNSSTFFAPSDPSAREYKICLADINPLDGGKVITTQVLDIPYDSGKVLIVQAAYDKNVEGGTILYLHDSYSLKTKCIYKIGDNNYYDSVQILRDGWIAFSTSFTNSVIFVNIYKANQQVLSFERGSGNIILKSHKIAVESSTTRSIYLKGTPRIKGMHNIILDNNIFKIEKLDHLNAYLLDDNYVFLMEDRVIKIYDIVTKNQNAAFKVEAGLIRLLSYKNKYVYYISEDQLIALNLQDNKKYSLAQVKPCLDTFTSTIRYEIEFAHIDNNQSLVIGFNKLVPFCLLIDKHHVEDLTSEFEKIFADYSRYLLQKDMHLEDLTQKEIELYFASMMSSLSVTKGGDIYLRDYAKANLFKLNIFKQSRLSSENRSRQSFHDVEITTLRP